MVFIGHFLFTPKKPSEPERVYFHWNKILKRRKPHYKPLVTTENTEGMVNGFPL